MDYVQILKDMLSSLVEDKASLKIVQRPSLEEDEVLLYVYAAKEDISRLIGKKGNMASAIRQIMSVPSRLDNKRISIKFESYDE
ncbi:MAG TPA: KH domain-containing protein [Candidatus Fimiplasma intestinipullorum]|uniref:KH domain-containing protein n=1 Tax=Candidatus Fimiplasma intestinipullorum TaxID=2840825 RepID=A0A9D1HM26_9FIRM|nr:KH domain-containing protein [Candidatus Fimiplasma intestinipullorum]